MQTDWGQMSPFRRRRRRRRSSESLIQLREAGMMQRWAAALLSRTMLMFIAMKSWIFTRTGTSSGWFL